MNHFSIAGMQLDLASQNNLYRIEKEINQLVVRFPWIDMIVLGELATYGPNPANASTIPSEAEIIFCNLARKHQIWLVPGTWFEKNVDNKVHNTCLAINPQGEVVARYHKMYPFLPYEKGVSAGNECVVFDVPNVGRFGLSICYDQWFPETTRALTTMGAEIIIHPTMTNTIDRDAELAISRASALINQCYFFSVNVAGDLGNGRSIVVNPNGEVIHECGENKEIFPVVVDLDLVKHVREYGMHGLGQPLKSFVNTTTIFRSIRFNSNTIFKPWGNWQYQVKEPRFQKK